MIDKETNFITNKILKKLDLEIARWNKGIK